MHPFSTAHEVDPSRWPNRDTFPGMTDFHVRRCAARLLGVLLIIGTTLLPAQAAAAPGPGGAVAAPGDGGRAGVWPLHPRPAVVRGFEPPPKPWLPGHRGVDLLGTAGQQVRAAADGIVAYAGTLAGRGVVVVSHGSTRTTYEPVLAAVRVGAQVGAGDPLGSLSAAGSHCPPRVCLHWGLLRGRTYLDPLSMLRAAPIRLLPTGHGSATGQVPAAGQAADRGGAGPPTHRAAGSGRAIATEVPDGPVAGSEGSSSAGRAVVGVAALVTIAAGLLIRRH
jgi:Peptidase family M23